jgi:CheY-like chemotaxis protein
MDVLLVEDERLISFMISRILVDLGHTVTACVASAEKALLFLEGSRPDFILLDIRLEGKMDGIEAGLIIKEKWGIPFAFASAYTDEETKARAAQACPIASLTKPLRSEQLRGLLELAARKPGGAEG